MDSNSRTTWILVAGALALLAFILFVEQPMREARQRQTIRKILPQFNPASVTNIQIRPAGQMELRADRIRETWQMTRPLPYPANSKRVEKLLEKLADLEWRHRISAQELAARPQAQEEFGFATPQFSLTFQDGREPRRLLIGATSALGDEVFIQVVGGDSVFLVGADLLKDIPRTKNDWRDTAFLSLEDISFDSLKVRAAGKRAFELKRESANSLWRLREPPARANSPRIDELLAQLQSLQVAAFVSDDAQADLDSFGLRQPLQTPELELSFYQDTNAVLTLELGSSPTNQPKLAYARRLDRPTIVLVPKEPLRAWCNAYTNFLDRHLISAPPGSIASIEVQGEDRFTLRRRDGGQWEVSGKDTFIADQTLVNDWLVSLSEVDVEIEKTVVADLAGYGLARPLLRYVITSALPGESNLVARLDFGVTNQTGKIFQRCADETSVNLIKREQFDRLPRASWQLRDRRIFDFESSNVVSVTVLQQGSKRKLIRDFQGEWTFAPGSIGTIDPDRLDEALHRLGQLKAVYWSGCGETRLEGFGFAETDHQVCIDVKDGDHTNACSIQFGKASPYVHPYACVMINGQRRIFEFPAPLYQDFVQRALTIPPAYRARSK